MEQFDNLFEVSKMIAGYLKDDLNEKQQLELQAWLNAKPENQTLFNKLTAAAKLKSDYAAYGATDKITAWARIARETGYRSKQKSYWPRTAAAASVIFCLSVGGYFALHHKTQPVLTALNEIKPGSNGAILTLANGRKIVLEQAKTGQVAPGVQKANDSLLVYSNDKTVAYNTLETPKGKQYAVVLPDGSKVWLNAASSLKYPTAFTAANRTVELTGEGYFEVIHNARQPFKVKAGNQTIEDIGTHFNVNAYTDEPETKTTLLEGAIKVNNLLLKPGQQTDGENITEVNTAVAVAWKDGYFYFDHADIKAVMRQIARWYNVEVVYEGVLPKKQFKGKVYRNVSIKQALKILEFFNVHFRIEGKKVTVTA